MHHYLKSIWISRYFWFHLAQSDLRSRWRRSFLGIFWTIVQPLGMTLLLAVVFSKMFHVSFISNAPYILSGIIVWDFIASTLTNGSNAFVQSEQYIKQSKHPLVIYPLRLVLGNLGILAMSSLVLFAWALIALPQNFGWCWLTIFTFFPIIALMAWPVASFLAYIGARFRDVPHLMGLILQAIWFVSPVYFQADMFHKAGLGVLIDFNPIYHILELIRAPLLHGQWPTIENYLFCFLTMFIFTILAALVGIRAERKVIFYL